MAPVSSPRLERGLAKHYSEKYHCSVRTIKRWKKAGYPIEDPLALLIVLGKKNRVPDGLKSLLGRIAS